MATGQLALYNVALTAIGERTLDSLTDDGEPRRELDAVWSRGNGAVRYFLEQGHWNFALRSVQADASSSVSPSFGYVYAFEIPTDFVRLNMISVDERFHIPLNDYAKEQAYFFSDVTPIYIRYVSDDTAYGGDFSLWPETFTLWAGSWLGLQIAKRYMKGGEQEMQDYRDYVDKLLLDARSKDAQDDPAIFPPMGSWATARLGGRGTKRDMGRRDRLTGP